MVTCEIDGIWCKKCQTMHPTLYWHEKYNDYELNREEKWNKMKEKRPKLFEDAYFVDNLYLKEIKEEKDSGKCVVCNCETFFKSTITNQYICSDICKYNHLEKIVDK